MTSLRQLRALLDSPSFRLSTLLRSRVRRRESAATPPVRSRRPAPPLALETLEDRLPPGDLLGLLSPVVPGALGLLPGGAPYHTAPAVASQASAPLAPAPAAAPSPSILSAPASAPGGTNSSVNALDQFFAGHPAAENTGGIDSPFQTVAPPAHRPQAPDAGRQQPPMTGNGGGLLVAPPAPRFMTPAAPAANTAGDMSWARVAAQQWLAPTPTAPAAPTPIAAPTAAGPVVTSTPAAAPAAVTIAAATPAPTPAPVPAPTHALLVQFRAGQASSLDQLTPLIQSFGATATATGIDGLYSVKGAEDLTPLQAQLSAQPSVLYAQVPQTIHVASTTPNDPSYTSGTLWGLNGTYGINAPAAWNVTTGSPTTPVAVIDTGVDYNQPDLYDNVWINQAEIPNQWYTKPSPSSTTYDKVVYKSQIQTATPGVITFRDLNNPANAGLVWDNNADGVIDAGDLLRPLGQGGWDSGSTQDGDTAHPDDFFGWNFVANNNNPFDDNGHGTHVSGIIGAVGNNGVGVTGVDWNAPIMALKFLDSSGNGQDSNAALAIHYAVAHGARVANASWQGTSNDATLEAAIQYASTATYGTGQGAGMVFVAAAGNSSENTDVTPNYPSAFTESNILSVASINSSGALSSFSNYGPTTVDVAAPGENIYSTLPNNTYGDMSGTSMATPYATGTAALLLSQNPSWSATQVISRIENTVTADPSLSGKTVTGGIVNAGKALAQSSGSVPGTVTGLTATAASSTQVSLSWSDVSGESGFTIQRSADGTNWAQLATTAAGLTSYQDSGLSASTTYYYRVQATNSAGAGPFSSSVTATTQAAPPVGSGVLFSDNFSSSSVNPAWKFVGGTWTQSAGTLSQSSSNMADPKKAVLVDQTYPTNVIITAKVRVNSWAGGDYARAGVSLYNDPSTGAGYNLIFHGGTGSGGTVQFLDDGNAWGNSYSFNWSVGAWYWFKLEENNGVLYGKVWQDGTAEPTNWMFTQTGWTDRTGGAPGLHGGSNNNDAVSFASVTVSSLSGQTTPPSAPGAVTGLTATATSSTQVNLSWSDVSGESGFTVQRSADGTNWAQLATTAAGVTSYQDSGLSASTTYYYRVQATNSAGAGPFSSSVTATTQAAGSAPALFSDNFGSSSVNPAWKFVGGTWTQSSGTLSQSSSNMADPKKALLTDQTYPTNVVITAKVRVNSWSSGDYARAGVSLHNDPSTGAGYNLIFHGGTGSGGTVQFLDDGNAWGNSYSFNWSVGTWYWFKLEENNGVLYGKVWADGTAEPTSWMFTQTGWTDRTGGAPGLHGGSNNNDAVSFTDVTVTSA